MFSAGGNVVGLVQQLPCQRHRLSFHILSLPSARLRIAGDTDGDGVVDTRAVVGGNIGEPERSNGIIYAGFGGFKIGWDSERNRHNLQNRLAHDGLSRNPQFGARWPWMLMLDRRSRFVFQFGRF